MRFLSLLLGAWFFCQPSFASRFANQFVEFELPAQWRCNLEGAEWVCQNVDKGKSRDAIVILAAKLRGDQDSIDQYLKYLKEAKSYTSVKGKPVKSEAKYAKTVDINSQPWVDALHLESEIPGFYTRYLATIKQDIGVLVTFSVNKAKYTDYINDIENMVKTLKVFRKSGGLNTTIQPSTGNIFNTGAIPSDITDSTVFPSTTQPQGADTVAAKPKQEEDDTLFYLILVAVGLVGYVIWKRKRGA